MNDILKNLIKANPCKRCEFDADCPQVCEEWQAYNDHITMEYIWQRTCACNDPNKKEIKNFAAI